MRDMTLISKQIKAQYVHGPDQWAIRTLFGAPVLVYGEEGKKAHQGIAFGSLEIMQAIALSLLKYIEDVRSES